MTYLLKPFDFIGRYPIPYPVLQGFSGKYYPNIVRYGVFSENPKGACDITGQWDTGLLLYNEIGVGRFL